jgi:hypothetical protein
MKMVSEAKPTTLKHLSKAFFAWVLVLALLMVGCSTESPPEDLNVNDTAGGLNGKTIAGSLGELFSGVFDRPADDEEPAVGGDEYGQLGETLDNAFFSWKVTAVTAAETIGGKIPSPGYMFVRADIEVLSTSTEEIPVGNFDFFLLYGWRGETIEEYAYEEFAVGMYPDEVYIEPGESLSGYLVFEVPDFTHQALITYYEDYDDGMRGKSQYVEVTF